jgi:hypothetical protein
MALVEATLKANLLDLFNTMKQAPMSEADYAAKLAKIVNDHIKTAQVNSGIPVTTPVGQGTTSGTGTLS